MTKPTTALSLTGPDLPALAAALRAHLPTAPPDAFEVDDAPAPPDVDLADVVASGRELGAVWHGPPHLELELDARSCRLHDDRPPSVDAALALLSALPFSVAVGAPRGPWGTRGDAATYVGPTLPDHLPLGWMLALRGDGLRHLPSPAWLEGAPVTVHRAGDVLLLQLHDLDAPPARAFAQARAAHAFLDPAAGGLLLPRLLEPGARTAGAWDRATGTLTVSFARRAPRRTELADLAAIRVFGLLGPGRVVQRVLVKVEDGLREAVAREAGGYGLEVAA